MSGQRCVRGGRRVREDGGVGGSDGEEHREGILINSAATPAISTYETDRAKHQLMQKYPHGDPAHFHLDSQQQQQLSDYSNDRNGPRDADGKQGFRAGLFVCFGSSD